MKDISLFGCTGFIGSRFCEMYKDNVIKIERNDYSPKSNNILYFISTVDNYHIHNNLHIDIDTNLSILMNVLSNIDRNDKDLVINFVSSWFVYGKNEILPFNEDTSTCNPTGFYSITKRCAEQMLISFCETFDIKYRIFRLSNILGEGDGKISRKKNALQYIIKSLCYDEDVHLYQGGDTIRDYMYVDDACDAMYHCMIHSPINQIINIANGEPYVLGEVIHKAAILADSKSVIHNIDPPHFHSVVQVRNSYLDVSKLKSYGFKNNFTMDDIISRLVSFYKQERKQLQK
jgi:nucleoside-diphosphate-sugar epimerase